MKKWKLYEWSIFICFILIPVTGILINESTTSVEKIGSLALKWFVFSGIGLRLLTAGIKQILNPAYTAQDIFGLDEKSIYVIVQEIGYSNISIAIPALISIVITSFRVPIGITGCLYYGLAGIGHMGKKNNNQNELFAEISDFFMFTVLLIALVC